jgi:hypothetical protein
MVVNVDTNFMDLAMSFLRYKVGSIPFKYLALRVETNPMRLETWEPLIELIAKRLWSWSNRFVSLVQTYNLCSSTLYKKLVNLLS